MIGLGNISILSPPCNVRIRDVNIANIFIFQYNMYNILQNIVYNACHYTVVIKFVPATTEY